jgi:hypothetical protein
VRYIFYVLIVVSAVVSTVALLGALVVGYSTSKTIAGLPPKRDAGALLTAFPADIDTQIKRQSTVSTGVAVMPTPAEETQQLADSLRSTLQEAAGNVPATDAGAGQELPDAHDLAAQLEGLLLNTDSAGAVSIETLREYALRQLSTQDGKVVLPNYSASDLANVPGLTGELAAQIEQLQLHLSQQISALPELQDREIELQDIQLSADPRQLAAAIEGLDLQADLFGLEIGSELRYESLQSLGEELLGGNASLEGLDMTELEAISRDIVSQLGESTPEADQN